MITVLRINNEDTVAILPAKAYAGEQVTVSGSGDILTVLEDINAGHKIAVKDLKKDELVIKYGIPIGKMSKDCKAGAWVHEHNLIDNTEELCTGYCNEFKKSGTVNPPEVIIDDSMTLMAYPRRNGSFGIRNYIMIFSTSLVSNVVAEELSNNTGVFWWACDRRTLKNGHIDEKTQYYLRKAACGCNIFAALIIGTEEDREINESLRAAIEKEGLKPVFYSEFNEKNHDDCYGECFDVLAAWKKEAAEQKRERVPFAGFTISVHCAGSDWTTALYGNPTLGVASDLVVSHGGYVLMDEWGGFPGSEHILASHAANRELAMDIIDKVQVIRDKVYAETGKKIEEIDPYPSNKKAGITTMLEKSIGNIKKAGTAPIQGILKIGTRPDKPGVYLQDQPSIVAYGTGTFSAMNGCHMNVLVSGVGYNYFELPYMPVIRTTGNPETFKLEKYKLDFNTGTVLEGRPMEEVGQELFDFLVAVAEGRVEPKCEIGKARGTTMYNEDDEYNQGEYCRYKAWRINVMDRIRRVGK